MVTLVVALISVFLTFEYMIVRILEFFAALLELFTGKNCFFQARIALVVGAVGYGGLIIHCARLPGWQKLWILLPLYFGLKNLFKQDFAYATETQVYLDRTNAKNEFLPNFLKRDAGFIWTRLVNCLIVWVVYSYVSPLLGEDTWHITLSQMADWAFAYLISCDPLPREEDKPKPPRRGGPRIPAQPWFPNLFPQPAAT